MSTGFIGGGGSVPITSDVDAIDLASKSTAIVGGNGTRVLTDPVSRKLTIVSYDRYPNESRELFLPSALAATTIGVFKNFKPSRKWTVERVEVNLEGATSATDSAANCFNIVLTGSNSGSITVPLNVASTKNFLLDRITGTPSVQVGGLGSAVECAGGESVFTVNNGSTLTVIGIEPMGRTQPDRSGPSAPTILVYVRDTSRPATEYIAATTIGPLSDNQVVGGSMGQVVFPSPVVLQGNKQYAYGWKLLAPSEDAWIGGTPGTGWNVVSVGTGSAGPAPVTIQNGPSFYVRGGNNLGQVPNMRMLTQTAGIDLVGDVTVAVTATGVPGVGAANANVSIGFRGAL